MTQAISENGDPTRHSSVVRTTLITVLFLWVMTVNVLGQTTSCPELLATPVYPPLARQARIEGPVMARFSISAEGTPTNIATTGHPLLVAGVAGLAARRCVETGLVELDAAVLVHRRHHRLVRRKIEIVAEEGSGGKGHGTYSTGW